MKLFRLRVSVPGGLFSRILDREVTLDQFQAISKLVEEPERFVLMDRSLLAMRPAMPDPVALPVPEVDRMPVGFRVR